jgi:glycerol-3-phosphate acyltransferase PlsY
MSLTAQLGLVIAGAYLLGSVPVGLLIALAKGVDPRKSGSGNIGATNVARALGGKKWFFLVFFLDMFKALIPMLIASAILRNEPKSPGIYALWICAGVAAVLGHLFSVFLKFKGGKGVATSAGVVLGLWPYYTIPGLLTILTFLVTFFIWRYVSLGSIAAAVSMPVWYVLIGLSQGWPITGQQWPLLAFAIAIGALIVFKHRTNIARLRAGTEPKSGRKTG